MKLLIYILRLILSRFGIKPVEIDCSVADDSQDTTPPVIIPPVEPSPVKPLSIPHPEEPPDWDLTLHDVDVFGVINEWLQKWEVPTEYWSYWQTIIDMQVYDEYPDYMIRWGVQQDWASFTWFAEGKRHMAITPAWLNPGVVAHEQAHSSYDLLTEDEQFEFETTYIALYLANDPMTHLMDHCTNYINYPIDNEPEQVETHAEVYRFLGQQMPESLKRFYPKLI